MRNILENKINITNVKAWWEEIISKTCSPLAYEEDKNLFKSDEFGELKRLLIF
jgi:hypothetical protein